MQGLGIKAKALPFGSEGIGRRAALKQRQHPSDRLGSGTSLPEVTEHSLVGRGFSTDTPSSSAALPACP